MKNIIGLKELRENIAKYIKEVQEGKSFLVMRRSEPIFKISPFEDETWEEIIDFTKIKKGGVNIHELLGRL